MQSSIERERRGEERRGEERRGEERRGEERRGEERRGEERRGEERREEKRREEEGKIGSIILQVIQKACGLKNFSAAVRISAFDEMKSAHGHKEWQLIVRRCCKTTNCLHGIAINDCDASKAFGSNKPMGSFSPKQYQSYRLAHIEFYLDKNH